ncbi:hypothetical protein CEXT_288951 [Caerostris extrusa]|uniref:Uncharacterized protein n=1 Tax=Caerostris extrusa TaxID=172846 RepID=A0AAV4XZY1_CAEEX|nr:hypothetical protein CEXT_288951 [Caerostris extrusa]
MESRKDSTTKGKRIHFLNCGNPEIFSQLGPLPEDESRVNVRPTVQSPRRRVAKWGHCPTGQRTAGQMGPRGLHRGVLTLKSLNEIPRVQKFNA